MKHDFPIAKTLVLDTFDLAELLEVRLAEWLMPSEHSPVPIAPPGRTGQAPATTHQGVAMIQDAVEWIVGSRAKWRRKKYTNNPSRLGAVLGYSGDELEHAAAQADQTIAQAIRGHLRPEFRDSEQPASIDERVLHLLPADMRRQLTPSKDQIQEHLRLAEIADRNAEIEGVITETLADLRSNVMTFIGEDVWVMHFVRKIGRDLVVEKTLDFRIYDWTQRMESGEWNQ